jgi:hypothetical protein
MSGAGKYGELRFRHPGEIAHHPAAEQSEQLDGVFEADAVRISQDDQGWRDDPADVVRRPGEGRRVELLQLLDQYGKVARVRRAA